MLSHSHKRKSLRRNKSKKSHFNYTANVYNASSLPPTENESDSGKPLYQYIIQLADKNQPAVYKNSNPGLLNENQSDDNNYANSPTENKPAHKNDLNDFKLSHSHKRKPVRLNKSKKPHLNHTSNVDNASSLPPTENESHSGKPLYQYIIQLADKNQPPIRKNFKPQLSTENQPGDNNNTNSSILHENHLSDKTNAKTLPSNENESEADTDSKLSHSYKRQPVHRYESEHSNLIHSEAVFNTNPLFSTDERPLDDNDSNYRLLNENYPGDDNDSNTLSQDEYEQEKENHSEDGPNPKSSEDYQPKTNNNYKILLTKKDYYEDYNDLKHLHSHKICPGHGKKSKTSLVHQPKYDQKSNLLDSDEKQSSEDDGSYQMLSNENQSSNNNSTHTSHIHENQPAEDNNQNPSYLDGTQPEDLKYKLSKHLSNQSEVEYTKNNPSYDKNSSTLSQDKNQPTNDNTSKPIHGNNGNSNVQEPHNASEDENTFPEYNPGDDINSTSSYLDKNQREDNKKSKLPYEKQATDNSKTIHPVVIKTYEHSDFTALSSTVPNYTSSPKPKVKKHRHKRRRFTTSASIVSPTTLYPYVTSDDQIISISPIEQITDNVSDVPPVTTSTTTAKPIKTPGKPDAINEGNKRQDDNTLSGGLASISNKVHTSTTTISPSNPTMPTDNTSSDNAIDDKIIESQVSNGQNKIQTDFSNIQGEPTVWIRTTNQDIIEKLTNNNDTAFDIIYFFNMLNQPIIEREKETTIFCNGTVVIETKEITYANQNDPTPTIVKTTETIEMEDYKPFGLE